MATVAESTLMTTEEFLAMPDNGVDRWLVRGQLREASTSEDTMTVRNRWRSEIMACLSKLLGNWLDRQPLPRGMVVCGEAGFRLQHDPDIIVGIDVACISADVAKLQSEDTTLIEGIPVLAVEILSPSDQQKDIDDKIDLYQETGVPLIWVINPRQKTVVVYRQDAAPELINIHQELSGEPYLPGFRVSATQLFE